MPRDNHIDIARAVAVVLMMRGERTATFTRRDYEKLDRLFHVNAAVSADGGEITVTVTERASGQKQLPLAQADQSRSDI